LSRFSPGENRYPSVEPIQYDLLEQTGYVRLVDTREVAEDGDVYAGSIIWSDDSDFDDQNLVETYSTTDVVNSFDTRYARHRVSQRRTV
jgi:hypothetical protein